MEKIDIQHFLFLGSKMSVGDPVIWVKGNGSERAEKGTGK